MYGMEPYDIVRLAVTHEGLSHREAARRFGIDPRTVKVYVRGHKLAHKEMFVPLAHAPGHAQVDPRFREGKLWRGRRNHWRRAAEDSLFLYGAATL
jgi:hypothetical protein